MTPIKAFGISIWPFLVVVVLSIFACGEERKLSNEDIYYLAINNQHVYLGENVFIGENKIGRDSFNKIIKESREIGLDYYVNKKDEITKIVVRDKTTEDSILIDRVNAYLRGECLESLSFGKIECGTDTLNSHDILYGKTNEGEMLELSKVKRTHLVFPPCKRINYRAIHLSPNKDTISKSLMGILNSNKNYEMEYMDQRILEFGYLFTKNDRLQYKDYLRDENMNRAWVCRSKEGYIENEERFWMHPPRNNQFITFELVPFPEIRFPLEDGKRWTSRLSIQDGWGDWTGLSVYCEYGLTVDEKTNHWVIKGNGKVSNGDTTSIQFSYDETKGIKEMSMMNHLGEIFTLTRMADELGW